MRETNLPGAWGFHRMMLARIIQFLIGAAFGAGGGYLVWNHRGEMSQLFPPGPEGLPLMLVAGIGAVSLGVVFLASAIAPRPKRTARLQAAASRRAETLRAADSYYAERSRAADRDWRSGKLPPHTPAPAGPTEPAADSFFDQEPMQAEEPAPPADPLFDPRPVRTIEPPQQDDALFDPPARYNEPAPAPVASKAEPAISVRPAPQLAEPVTRPAAAKPVATSVPPTPVVFPSTATLAPIPKSSEPPPHVAPPPALAPEVSVAAAAPMALPVAPPAAASDEPEQTKDFADIRAAIKDGRLEDADRLLNASREIASGLALAELTGLAGDHAAAAGRQSNAKWLWRLALKRFGEEGALDSPAARQVSERLRLAGQ
jgi:hypothetical protein